MRKALTPLIGVLVGLAFLIPVAIGLMQGRVIEIELAKPKTAKEALQQAYTKHFQEKDYQRAIEKYRWIVERFPDSDEAIEAQYRIGNIYQWDLVEPEKAIREYEKLRGRYPDSNYAVAALIRIGESYGRMKEYEKEIECCRRVIEEHPDSGYVAEAKAVMAGTLLFELGKMEKAKEIYQDLVENYPDTEYADDAKVWLIYISLWEDRMPMEDALKECRTLAADKDLSYNARASAQYMLGYLHYLQEDYDEAIKNFKEVLSRFPRIDYGVKAEVHYFLGYLYRRKAYLSGEESEALKALKEFDEIIENFSNSTLVDKAKAKRKEIEKWLRDKWKVKLWWEVK